VDIHVDVTLKLPDPSAVTSFIASLSNRNSPNFHHFLRPGQFGQLFGPSLSEVAAVDAVLRADGLHPGRVTSDRLSIPVTGPAPVIDRAFHVSLASYRLPGGRTAFTTLSPPSISAAVAPDVEGVVGLSDLFLAQSLAVRSGGAGELHPSGKLLVHPATAGGTPCAAASGVTEDGSYTADQLASYYGMTPLYSLDDLGQGVKVALAEFEPDSASNISAYAKCYGILSPTVNYVPVDQVSADTTDPGTDPEAALDIEDVMGLAPDATIDVYQAPTPEETSVYDVDQAIVDADADQVVSTSWGLCEIDTYLGDSSFMGSEQDLFYVTATQDQTVFASAGDNGSTDCYGDKDTLYGSYRSVDDPASQPYVVGVGGTSIGRTSETVWNNSSISDGAGGGGLSDQWCMPSYQDQLGIPGLISADSETEPTDCGTTDPYVREVPDVSADANPMTGYAIYYTGGTFGGWGPIGGTSAAAPLWAAAAALIDSSPFCAAYGSGDAGVQPVGLYYIMGNWPSGYYGLALKDITAGNNDYTPDGYSGGLYPATAGYDMASGLGSPHIAYAGNFYPGLAAQMCFYYNTEPNFGMPSITGVSPDDGLSSVATPVTITGSNFLPIAGADQVEVGANSVTVSCTTTTSCTGTLPATKSGTDHLVMSVQDMALSSKTAADQFTFVQATSTTAITSVTSSPVVGQPVSVRVKVTGQSTSSGSLAPSGNVTVSDGTRSCNAALSGSNGIATGSCSIAEQVPGKYSLTASYPVNSYFAASATSGSTSLTVGKATSTTALKLSSVKITYGDEQLEHLSVTISPQYSGSKPTGTVKVAQSTTTLCMITLSSGKGSCALSAKKLQAGTYRLVATYGGSTNFKGSTSAKETLTVVK
jgi:subtilase family serine protease